MRRSIEPAPATADDVAVLVKAVTTPEGRVCWFPDTAVLTRKDVAAVLDMSERTVERLPIRVAYPSRQSPRYLYRDVVAFLEARAA